MDAFQLQRIQANLTAAEKIRDGDTDPHLEPVAKAYAQDVAALLKEIESIQRADTDAVVALRRWLCGIIVTLKAVPEADREPELDRAITTSETFLETITAQRMYLTEERYDRAVREVWTHLEGDCECPTKSQCNATVGALIGGLIDEEAIIEDEARLDRQEAVVAAARRLLRAVGEDKKQAEEDLKAALEELQES